MEIEIKRLDDSLPLPEYKHRGEDAGMDLYSREEGVLKPGKYGLFKTGIAIALPRGYAGFINPRSGLAVDYGVTVLNADGVIDPGYRGEIGVPLINHGAEEFKVKKKTRIAQLVVQKYEEVEWKEVEELSTTDRGEGGFGHTGLRD
ncbi:dUTP diphosphatase [Acetohalobium arabaticum]|uniref:Deoxyuridine 5'-triphosphate nucleotidohydrolase n=1 Tax=Acetohalobium arabaticum (strain ATCC 49924 / DSM 5501 / Z-7288) TaxID=574087 RepID=D9QRE8_ACEAZ|nr:dUTP diphosphatase [Acetohalobium arabaticum]ADL13089.1 deoxyuridine 5'-triphosphate nucleotidohydrolase [Acetohalobium arabaticum DSM 5501]